MALNHEALANWQIADARQTYTERDTILYALGLGLGADPVDPRQLAFVYEKSLKALPTLGFVIGTPGAWFADPRIGIDFTKLLNAGVSARFHALIPPSGEVLGRSRVVSLADKGKERGALLVSRRELFDGRNGTLLAEMTSNYLLRGNGGFGGKDVPSAPPHPLPDAAPEATFEYRTLGQLGLIYRLSGDVNPLHADPTVAKAAGFPAPILHGLATFGVAGWVILSHLCGADPTRLRSLEARFSAPFFPGETLLVEVWRTGAEVSFRARSRERDVVVLNNGRAEIVP
jgi:acyl dehydratase